MRGLKSFSITSLLMSWALSVAAQEAPRTRMEVNHEVVRTYAGIYLEQKDFLRAEEVIARYLFLSNEKGEGELWQELGDLQMVQSKLPEACHSFLMAAGDAKDKNGRLKGLYSQARCLNRIGRIEDSKKVLAQMASEEVGLTNAGSRVLSLLQSGYIKRYEEFPPYGTNLRGQWRINAAIGAGYDSNVLLVADSVAAGISAAGKASSFYSPALQVGRVGRIFGDYYDSRLFSVYTLYTNPEAAGFNSSYTRGDFQVGSGPVRWGLFGDAYFLNRSPFQLYSYSGGLSWAVKFEQSRSRLTTLEVPIQYQSYLLDSGTNDRTGADAKIKISKRWSDGSNLALMQLVFDGQYSLGRNYRSGGVSLPAFFIAEIPVFSWIGLQNTFSYEVTAQYFFQSETARRDLFLKAGTGLTRNFGQTWNFSFEMSGQKNLSVLETARYSKLLFTAQLNHQF